MTWRPLLLALAALGACGSEPDDRPVTFEVVTLTVLAPTCGQVQCHSTVTQTEGLAFDTLDAARESLDDLGVRPGVGRDLLDSDLWEVMAGDGEPMPPDSPLADADLDLVRRWLVADAPGL